MTVFNPLFSIVASYTPSAVFNRIMNATRWRAPLASGALKNIEVRFDNDDSTKGQIQTRWASPTALADFIDDNPTAFAIFLIDSTNCIGSTGTAPKYVDVNSVRPGG
jgi:hypothetical protein